MSGIHFDLRSASADDFAFIAETWTGSALKIPGVISSLGDRPAWQLTQRARSLLARHGAMVAADAEDSTVILGWRCAAKASGQRPDLFLWAYVRESFRHSGIARALLADLRDGRKVVSATRLFSIEQGRAVGKPMPANWTFMSTSTDWALQH